MADNNTRPRSRPTRLGLYSIVLAICWTCTITVVASTVEVRDPYTAGHQRRVATLAKAIAEEMGLTPHQILIEAKIICVADVVEAMASHRPYRPARGVDVALEHIMEESGTLYDTTAVDSCLKLFSEKGFQFD